MIYKFKSILFFVLFVFFFIAIGGLIANVKGIIFAFTFILISNFIIYYFSEKIVLRTYKAKKLDTNKYSHVYNIAKELSKNANIKMPKLWIIESNMANAFATGRNQNNASVIFTTEIIDILDLRELRAVLAHELSHIKNKDVLIGMIVTTLISLFLNLRFKRKNNSFLELVILFSLNILTSLVLTMVKAAVSRSREYLADKCGAEISKDPLALANALRKLQENSENINNKNYYENYSPINHLFIINPFLSKKFYELFSTHPSIEDRIFRLKNMQKDIK